MPRVSGASHGEVPAITGPAAATPIQPPSPAPRPVMAMATARYGTPPQHSWRGFIMNPKPLVFWNHLGNAGLINGTYAPSYAPFVPAGYPTIGGSRAQSTRWRHQYTSIEGSSGSGGCFQYLRFNQPVYFFNGMCGNYFLSMARHLQVQHMVTIEVTQSLPCPHGNRCLPISIA